MKKEFKRLSAIVLTKEQRNFMSALQQLGVLHLEMEESPQHEEIEGAIHKRNRIEGTRNTLLLTKTKSDHPLDGLSLQEVIERVTEIEASIDTYEQEIETDYKSLEKIEPWGDYS